MKDRIEDPTFVPCRSERCGIVGLHRDHSGQTTTAIAHEGWRLCKTCQTPMVSKSRALRLTPRSAICPRCSSASTKKDSHERD